MVILLLLFAILPFFRSQDLLFDSSNSHGYIQSIYIQFKQVTSCYNFILTLMFSHFVIVKKCGYQGLFYWLTALVF